jgi:hypothetical protein
MEGLVTEQPIRIDRALRTKPHRIQPRTKRHDIHRELLPSPNQQLSTTNISKIPAEIFPTRYRCTCHGIAAASGKLGSWLVQVFLAYAFRSEDPGKKDIDRFGQVLQVMSAFMVAGAITTYFLVPETRDHDNKSRTLEVLGCGKRVIDELNRQRRREDEDDP